MPLACGTRPPGARSPRSPALAGRLRFPGVTFSHVACQLLDYTPRRSVGWGSIARLAEVLLQGVRAHLQRRDRDRDHQVAQEGSLARPGACVHPTTAYRWRHRFLSAAVLDKPQTLPGDCGSGRNLHFREAPARSARHPHQERQRLPFAPQGVAASLPRRRDPEPAQLSWLAPRSRSLPQNQSIHNAAPSCEAMSPAGVEGLKGRSHAPIHHGRRREEELVAAALALHERHPTWGPKKLRRKLAERLARRGGAGQRHDRRLAAQRGSDAIAAAAAALSALCFAVGDRDDPQCGMVRRFQGLVSDWRREALRSFDDQRRDEPLSFALRGRGSARRGYVRDALDAAFCEFGLPRSIRSDNGPPFASTGAGFRCGGSSSACAPSRSIRTSRNRTAGMSGCIAR